MTLLYLFKVAIIQLFAIGTYQLLLAPTTQHQIKRWYLLGSLLFAFLVPLTTVQTVILPSLSDNSFNFLPSGMLSPVVAPATSFSFWPLALWLVYCGGTFIGLLRLFRSYAVIRRQRRVAVRHDRHSGAQWHGLDIPVAVHSFGKSIFYYVHHAPPAEVRAHELAHVRQRHTVDRLIVKALGVIWWFNPVLLFFERAIIHNHELLADTSAIAALRINPIRYQRSLLQALSDRPQVSPLGSYLPFSFTKKRFLMLQHPGNSILNLSLRLGATALVWAVLFFSFGHTVYAQSAPALPPPQAPPQAGANAPAPPPPPVTAIPCPPPPPISLENAQPHLDLTYGKYLKVWFKEEGDSSPDCLPFLLKGVDPDIKVRDWLRQRLESQLVLLTQALQPVTQAEFKQYLNPTVYGIWLDSRRIDNAALQNYPRTEIYRLFKPARLYTNAKDYGKYTYQLDLVSQQKIDKDVAKLREDIAFLEQ